VGSSLFAWARLLERGFKEDAKLDCGDAKVSLLSWSILRSRSERNEQTPNVGVLAKKLPSVFGGSFSLVN